jgi:hypothetical protein
MLVYVLVAFGKLLSKKNQLKEAAELLNYCQQHPAANAFTRERAEQLIIRLGLSKATLDRIQRPSSSWVYPRLGI